LHKLWHSDIGCVNRAFTHTRTNLHQAIRFLYLHQSLALLEHCVFSLPLTIRNNSSPADQLSKI
jgi:hypothetical protein